jgi:hypothetical protein
MQYILNSDGSEELFRLSDRSMAENLADDSRFTVPLTEMRHALRLARQVPAR